jgi:hypothetical protein
LIVLKIISINGFEGSDKCNFVLYLRKRGRIFVENAITASFNVRYLAISRIISQGRPVVVVKSND